MKKEKYLKILYKEVGELPKVMIIENTLEAKQELVNGLIEVIPYKDALIICNEEGKMLNMNANLIFDYDYIGGNCFAVGDDYKNGDFKSLTDEQIEQLLSYQFQALMLLEENPNNKWVLPKKEED